MFSNTLVMYSTIGHSLQSASHFNRGPDPGPALGSYSAFYSLVSFSCAPCHREAVSLLLVFSHPSCSAYLSRPRSGVVGGLPLWMP